MLTSTSPTRSSHLLEHHFHTTSVRRQRCELPRSTSEHGRDGVDGQLWEGCGRSWRDLFEDMLGGRRR
jgi:hypothetical protein